MSDPKTYTELRNDLMLLADQENKSRLALIEVQQMKNTVIAALVEKADQMMTRAFAELDSHGEALKEYQPKTSVRAVVEHVKPNRRCCSNCGEPGHRATTCTNERKPTAGEYIKVGAESTTLPRKPHKPMSPERKAKAVEALKKARAARGKGKRQ